MTNNDSTAPNADPASKVVDIARAVDNLGAKGVAFIAMVGLAYILTNYTAYYRSQTAEMYEDVRDCYAARITRPPQPPENVPALSIVLEPSYDRLKTPPTPITVTAPLWEK
jgi:alpha-ketoglutarate-dependent taurine dioxygenase